MNDQMRADYENHNVLWTDKSLRESSAFRSLHGTALLMGAGIEDVCKITTYLTDRSHRQSIYPVLAKHLQDVHPAVTSMVVNGLAQPILYTHSSHPRFFQHWGLVSQICYVHISSISTMASWNSFASLTGSTSFSP